MFSQGKLFFLLFISSLEVVSGITYVMLPHPVFPISNKKKKKKNYFCFYEQKEKFSVDYIIFIIITVVRVLSKNHKIFKNVQMCVIFHDFCFNFVFLFIFMVKFIALNVNILHFI